MKNIKNLENIKEMIQTIEFDGKEFTLLMPKQLTSETIYNDNKKIRKDYDSINGVTNVTEMTYDDNKNLIGVDTYVLGMLPPKEEDKEKIVLSYDEKNRLISNKGPFGSEEYIFDTDNDYTIIKIEDNRRITTTVVDDIPIHISVSEDNVIISELFVEKIGPNNFISKEYVIAGETEGLVIISEKHYHTDDNTKEVFYDLERYYTSENSYEESIREYDDRNNIISYKYITVENDEVISVISDDIIIKDDNYCQIHSSKDHCMIKLYDSDDINVSYSITDTETDAELIVNEGEKRSIQFIKDGKVGGAFFDNNLVTTIENETTRINGFRIDVGNKLYTLMCMQESSDGFRVEASVITYDDQKREIELNAISTVTDELTETEIYNYLVNIYKEAYPDMTEDYILTEYNRMVNKGYELIERRTDDGRTS